MFNPITEIKNTWQEIPEAVQKFLKRALILFVIWKLIYVLVLFPINIPDKQLRNATSWGTMQMLQWVYPNSSFSIEKKVTFDNVYKNELDFDEILMNNRKVLGIADPCNALELFILYMGFLLCFSVRKLSPLLIFLLSGLIIIYIVNILRCFGVAWLNIRHSYITEIAHHYVFKLAEYAVIFVLWVAYLRKQNIFLREHQ